ncbi:sensor histidine kinase [Jidongwangia harbinensis]|uniref:sensor histidine kinase n=1 Tax=Jidongwangia harbinensis TaxID=2878561 RepID=UPI001CDA34DF|nr:CHASE3 domain-containing protein [Jidongwangia harbinensis]MCA2214204.1 CHASE3 domain-containing protein [Jidongwangia harbinensis]
MAETTRTPAPRAGVTTQRLFTIILGVLSLLMLVTTVSGTYALTSTAAVSNRLSDRISPAATAVVTLRGALVDQETGVRGYLLSGDRDFLQPYRDGQAAEAASRERIRSLLPDVPAVQAQLGAVQAQAERWRSAVAEPMVAARDRQPAPPDTAALLSRGKADFDRIRSDLVTLESTIGAARTAARADLAGARQLRDGIFLAIFVVFVAGLAAVAVLLRLAVLRPLGRLRVAARQVAGGDFGQHLPRNGPRDLVDLADDMDEMRRQISDALTRSISAGEQLRQQAVELQRSNADLEQFAYVASHDLQEPLRKVASFCQMLERRYATELDDRGRQYLHFAVDGASRMQVLINDLLMFSRVGRVYDDVEDVDLHQVVEQAERDLSHRIEESGATVTYDGLPVVPGDQTLLALLWQNLLGNAVKFAHPGRPPRVTVEVRADDDEWTFAVADNGIGIESTYADKIFVIFQRLHPRGSYPGTGIGLALCKRIVEFHGGRIWLDDGYSGGARICFTLPRRS